MTTNKIILNSSNIRVGSNNSVLDYTFPVPVNFNKDAKVLLESASFYNSMFNIEAARSNNSISLTWCANTNVVYSWTIPDSFLDVAGMNAFLQQQCLLNKLYVTDAQNRNVFFVELVTNSSRYAVQLNMYALPNAAGMTAAGYSIPSGASWTAPTTASTPLLTLSANLGAVYGFSSGVYPTTTQTSNQSFLSSLSPEISQVNSIFIASNLINNSMSNPTNILTAIPVNASYGNLINFTNNTGLLSSVAAGNYSKITLQLLDQNTQNMRLQDNEITLVLVIVS